MGNFIQREDHGTARQFYADVSRPIDAREAAEENDAGAGVLCDEAAEKLRACGCAARDAARFAEVVLGVIRARDAKLAREVVGLGAGALGGGVGAAGAGVGGVGGGVELSEMAWMQRAEASDRLLQALSRAWDGRDTKLELGCLFFAMDKPPYGVGSMRKLAEARGVSPEAVSNEVEEFQGILGLPRNNGQKSARAVKQYQRTNGASARGEG